MDQDSKHLEGRGLQELLSHTLPHERRASVLDSPERGLPIQSHRYPLLPKNQEQHRAAEEQDSVVLQPGIRDRPGRGHRTRVPDSASWCDRLTRHPSERITFVRLKAIFNENRKEYEEKWDDLKLFINYGILSEDGFYDRAKEFALFKDTEGKYFTFDEYKTLIEANQKDKDDQLVYLYATDKEEQYSYIKGAQDKGYSVLLLDGQLDVPTIQTLEQKFEKSRFTRVDSDIIDRLIVKSDAPKNNLSEDQSDNLSAVFRTQLPKIEHTEFMVQVDALGAEARPVVITQNEYMRRMKEMSRFQPGMSFYGQMPDSFNLVLNSDHPLVKKVLDESSAATEEALKPIVAELKGQEARLAAIRAQQDKKKYDELTQEDKDQKAEAEKAVQEQKDKKQAVIAEYAKGNSVVHQLIDLALLQNGMLKGEALDAFLKRSVDLIK